MNSSAQILYKRDHEVALYCNILTLLWGKCSVSKTYFNSSARCCQNMSQKFVLNNCFSYRRVGKKQFSLLFLNVIGLCKWIQNLEYFLHGFYFSSMYFIIVNNV